MVADARHTATVEDAETKGWVRS